MSRWLEYRVGFQKGDEAEGVGKGHAHMPLPLFHLGRYSVDPDRVSRPSTQHCFQPLNMKGLSRPVLTNHVNKPEGRFILKTPRSIQVDLWFEMCFHFWVFSLDPPPNY